MNESGLVTFCPLCGKEFEAGVETCPADGAVLIRMQQQENELLGQVLKGSYRIEEKIGEGGMGTVYRAVQMPLDRAVAVKCLLPTLQSTRSMVQRFFQEAKLLSQLSHPNVVSIIDFGNTETGMIFMVMEYLEGSPLTGIVPLGKGLPLATAVQLMRQTCAGVAAAHRCNLVHRDLKPDNIFVAEGVGGQDVVKVLDFGIARVLEGEQKTRLTQTGLLMGTPGFIAPEQIEATAEADARADIYALGAILYFMLTGRRPYQGATPQSIFVQQLQEAPNMDFAGLSEPLAQVVLKAMHRDPEARFPSAEATVAALEEAVEEAAPTFVLPQHRATMAASSASVSSKAATPTTASADVSPLEPTVKLGTSEAERPSPWRRYRGLVVGVLVLALAIVGVLLSTRSGDRKAASGSAAAGDTRGVTANRITVGMSGTFSGASRELGRGMQLGLDTSFREVNENGGIHGRELELIALDDGYEPSR
ncbi:MAG: bifunctional serine/threonine-protein kinase/ABC transporter substrate-binding protein, partial [Acidobacteriota bacterium]